MAVQFDDTIGGVDATSYMSVEDADQYHENFGNDYWATLSIEQKQVALNRATAYIDKRFGPWFKGRRTAKSQALEWPRLDAYDDDGFALAGIDEIPRDLEQASAEYAIRAALLKVLAPDPLHPVPEQSFEDDSDRGEITTTGIISQESDSVGPIKTSRTYKTAEQVSPGTSRGNPSNMVSGVYIPEYPEADMLLEDLLESQVSIRAVRS